MKASSILSTKRPVRVAFLGDVLNFKYDLANLTDDLRRKVREKDTDLAGFEYGLYSVVCEWDWNNDDGKPLPIDQQTLSEMPYPLKMAMWQAILEDSDPKVLAKASRIS